MSTGQQAAFETFDWYVEPPQDVVEARPEPVYPRVRHRDERTSSLGLIVTTMLFFALFAAAIMVGGHAAIAPLLQRAATAGDTSSTGDIVYTMPDGVFCRHMSFDNTTGDIRQGGVEECQDHAGGRGEGSLSEFRWGASR